MPQETTLSGLINFRMETARDMHRANKALDAAAYLLDYCTDFLHYSHPECRAVSDIKDELEKVCKVCGLKADETYRALTTRYPEGFQV